MLNKHLALLLSSYIATSFPITAADTNKAPAKPAPAASTPAAKPAPKTAAKKGSPAPAKKTTAARRKSTPPLESANNNHVSVPRAALGREYLMSASLIPQAQAATSRGLAGKIVRFELFHNGVDLYESTQGLVVTDDLPARRLITTFPIVASDNDSVTIDFNQGMSRVFMEIWYGDSPNFDSGLRDQVAEIPLSRVFSVKRDKSALVIRQSAQVRDRRYSQNEEGRYEIRYFFSPYSKKKFTPKENTVEVERHARFFETQPQLEKTTGRTTVKIARFDLSKPVQFYYSANTPKDYEQAVMDGVLYWNRAFGKEIVKAAKAPRGVTAPASGHNVVQWVPWDSAGFAYADVLIDPRTGESRHGQAYMTSVFAFSGKARARALLRAMQKASEEKKDADTKDENAHKGIRFPGSTVCQVDRREFARRFAADLENLLATDELTDEAALRASQDYVREVVAHEVGHVLGLRHNFAGSLAATLSHKELDDWFKAYVKGDDLSPWKDKLSSSSMMEYTVFKGSVFTGWLMRAGDRVLPHDKAAIQWGYFDDKEVIKDKMLFGTDDHVGTYGDIQRFDYGTEPVVGSYAEIATYIDGLPEKLIEQFIRSRAPQDPRDRIPLEAVNLSVRSYAYPVASYFGGMLSWMKSGTRSLKLESQFPYIGDLNKPDRLKAHLKSLNDQVEKLGGVDRAFFSYLPIGLKLSLKDPAKGINPAAKIEPAKLTAELEKLLISPAYAEFVGLDEKKYRFTEDERKIIVARGKKLFTELETEVISQILGVLEKATRDLGTAANEKIEDNDVIAQFEKRVHALAETILTEKDPSKKISGLVSKSQVSVSDYKYDYDTRTAAAKALTDTIGSYRNWATEAKAGIHAKIKTDYEAQLNIANMKTFSDSMLSRPLRDWYLKQFLLLRLLPPAQPPAPPKK
ncbi:MAG: zinc-dependent metalloprotease [Verrucomicrobiae bacterium]|nr:zinc-dependent metalloprotease [Verrucomicrobiae bacterium]